MNNNLEEFGVFCPKKELKEWRENNYYRYKKVYTKFYVTNIYQELTWFIIITIFGIIGQLLFRLYYARYFFRQWWWLVIIYVFNPWISVIPALFLCMNFFWIDKIENYYNDNIKNNENVPYIINYFFKFIIRLFKPTTIPFLV
jgi:hypothetical protein